ncbi:unnamed protein product [Brachionus calyciflorus]|uniref:Uncharacterized protein n=1 Tax=Brachionus calyciflorus TaxID=104777 RepID=A0A814DWW6_9BILA|nr:unnamed protein product [Brachionus calyciflorus]
MNSDLVERSLRYHGKDLVELVNKWNENSQICYLNLNETNHLNNLTDKGFSNNEEDEQLRSRLLNFIAEKSIILFDDSKTDSPDIIILEQNKDKQAEYQISNSEINEFDIPPLETFMGLSSAIRKEHLFNFLKNGDIVIGSVVDITSKCILMEMICFDCDKKRDLNNIKINLTCSSKTALRSIEFNSHRSKNNSEKSELEHYFSRNDFVRCLITSIDKNNSTCEVSLNWNDEFPQREHVKLGRIQPETLPEYYKNIQDYLEEPFEFRKSLKYQKGFNNPACVKLFGKKLGIDFDAKFSFMDSLNKLEVKKEEMADELLKRQNKNLALEHVQKGVTRFKEGKSEDAILNYHKALQIDEECVEAFVARGALYGNQGELIKAIENFEKALEIDANHINAKKYLKEVLLAHSVKLEKLEHLEEAKLFLKKAIVLDPDSELIKSKIVDLEKKIESIALRNHYGPKLIIKPREQKQTDSSLSPPREKIIKTNSSHSTHHRKDDKNINEYKRNSSHHSRHTNHRAVEKKEEEEDLEAFFNQLKQNKATMKKK